MHEAEGAGGPRTPAWTPDAAHRARSRLLAAVGRQGHGDLKDLLDASVADPETFWRDVVDDLDITFDTPFERVLDDTEGKQFPRWFPGGKLNAATLCAHRHATGPLADKTAVVYEGDSGQRRTLTFAELDAQVRTFAAQLAALGVRRGDRVVLFVPVVPEAIVAFLSIAMLGAVSVPAFTGYGAEALATRLRDSEAVVLITSDGTTRRGKNVPMKRTADEALEAVPSVRHAVVVRHTGQDVAMRPGRDVYWDELPADPEPVETADTEANDPYTIVYTSGTTGRPKGIVHSHAGLAVKAATDFAYGFDVHADDVVAWITDLGWLVGPLLITGPLQLGATIVVIEGVPDYPSADRMWRIIERNGVTVQGIAPTGARAIKVADDGQCSSGAGRFAGPTSSGAPDPGPYTGLDTLRAFVSTGEAWDEPTWWWLFEKVGGSTRPIVNYSGGTEVGGGILIGYPFLPMDAAAFNGPLPGVDAAVFDQDGKAVTDQVGELVIRNTFPGMTHAFWQDRERYLETYWNRWDDVWVHGDLASVDGQGAWVVHGRSDDTIKLSGRRVGPAEIETALLRDPRIAEAAVIGVPDERRGQRAVGFVVVRGGGEVDHADLEATALANAGKSFAPALHVVKTLPKTKNGKIMRRAIRARHLGDPVGDMSSLDPATPLEDIPVAREQGERQ
ncbi:AMP-binding protein [Actinocorallia sp. API 0066]|uniref:AMP-binding protein n=1 Tax=Actinocorallia sp. API 0066 TaxID=2896846 RepID=UPI001E5A9C15|nr:AMP-binding protein [Actinocorallia sp. API 0066]MCD0451549.1 AMP-binding protein [Actinocorallia sp. API 0066]